MKFEGLEESQEKDQELENGLTPEEASLTQKIEEVSLDEDSDQNFLKFLGYKQRINNLVGNIDQKKLVPWMMSMMNDAADLEDNLAEKEIVAHNYLMFHALSGSTIDEEKAKTMEFDLPDRLFEKKLIEELDKIENDQ